MPAPDDQRAGNRAKGGRTPSYALLLATVSLGGILAPLNSTMLAVALPELRHDFGVGHAEIAWLVSAYLIAMAVAQPLGGRLGDQLGRARVFRTGLILFLVLSLAIALSPAFPVLILLRTGQALVAPLSSPMEWLCSGSLYRSTGSDAPAALPAPSSRFPQPSARCWAPACLRLVRGVCCS
ncbi:MAG: MFS transporter [Chloroflexi bacterium]|nr:MAG: MFS transporter [Chloroflexota bacterium]